MENQTAQERTQIDTKSLKELAIYLSGIKAGKGNLLPLGNIHLENLWNTIKYLHGDVRFYCKPQTDKEVCPNCTDSKFVKTENNHKICKDCGWTW
jgi:ribosomal protein S27AE